MDSTCAGSGGWIWLFVIIVVIIIIFLLYLWVYPCTSCGTGKARGNTGQPKQVEIFHVTVEEKDSSHPNYGKGCKHGYVINGVQGKSLTLKAGHQYRFMVRTNGYPFYIGTSEKGDNGSSSDSSDSSDSNEGMIDITGTPTESGSFPFIPTLDMPQPLYFVCKNQPYMGSSIIIVE